MDLSSVLMGADVTKLQSVINSYDPSVTYEGPFTVKFLKDTVVDIADIKGLRFQGDKLPSALPGITPTYAEMVNVMNYVASSNLISNLDMGRSVRAVTFKYAEELVDSATNHILSIFDAVLQFNKEKEVGSEKEEDSWGTTPMDFPM